MNDAFTIGREAVAASPHVGSERGVVEAGKFLLLPPTAGPDDHRHHVPIFDPRAAPAPPFKAEAAAPERSRALAVGAIDAALVPMPPEDFLGREVRFTR